MKTPLLKFSLILCLLFLGFKSAQAATNVNDVPQGNSTIYQGQTNIPLAAISVQNTNNSNITLGGATFTVNNQSLTGVFTNVRLVQSGATFDPGNIIDVDATAPFSITNTLITFSNFTSNNIRNTTAYFYLIADYTGATTTGSYQFTPKATTTSSNGTANIGGTVLTNTFTLSAPVLTLGVDNTGLAATTQSASNNALAIYGMSATSAGTSTFTKLNFTTTSATGDNISPTYTTVTLYKNTVSNSFTNFNTQAVTGTLTTIPANSSSVTINIPTAQTIADGATVYYFLVVKYVQPTTADVQMQFNTPTVTSTNGTTTTGNANGQNYTLSAPVITITASSLGSTNPTASGLTANPVVSTFTTQAIAGLQLVGSGTGPARTITSLTFDPTTSGTNSGLFGATAYLYSSTTAVFGGVGAPTTSASAIASAPLGADANNIVFSGLNISVSSTSTLYYFVVVNYAAPVDVSTTYELDYSAAVATGATVTKSATYKGPNYTFNVITITASSLGSTNPTAAGLAANPVNGTFTTQAIAGLQLVGSGTGPAKTITSLTFDPTTSGTNSGLFGATAYLYSSTTAAFGGVGAPTTSASAIASAPLGADANNIVFSGLNISVSSTSTLYYFVVVSYAAPVDVSTTYELDYSAAAGATVTKSATYKGPNYTFNVITITASSLGSTNPTAAGLAANPVNGTFTTQAIAGLQLVGSGTGPAKTITSLTFDPTTSGTNSGLFGATAYLYSSTTAAFGGVGAPTTSASAIASALLGADANNIVFSGLNISVSSTSTLYYFVVVSYAAPVDVSTTYELDYSAAAGATVTKSATYKGPNYTFNSITITATSLGSTGTNPTNGLATNPIVVPQTNVPIYGLQLTGTGTGPVKTITSLSFKPSNTQNNNLYYGNMYLYSSTTSTFMGVGAPQTSASPLATTATAGNTANLTFSGLNISVANGTTLYYFVLVDYAGYSGTGAASTSRLDFASAVGSTIAAGTANQGFNYTYSKPTLAVSANNGAAYTGNLDHDVSNTVLFSFLATPSGTVSVTGFTITGTGTNMANLSTYFPNSSLTLYSSTQSTFPGIASPLATLVKTINPTPTNTSIGITGLTQSISAPLYYYLVANYTDKIVDATIVGLQFQLTTVTTASTVTGLNVSGTPYTLSSPVTLDNPPFTNMAVSPLSTNASGSGVPILGFSVTTTQAESFNKFVLTTATGTTISPYFTGTPTLYVNTTASGSGGTAVPTGAYTVTATGITINLTTAQTIAGAGTLYYYLSFPTYTAPANSVNFELDASSVSTSTLTYTNGAPAQGTYYYLGPPVFDWVGRTSSAWTTASNWNLNGVQAGANVYPGQTGYTTTIIRIGTNVTYTTARQPTLTTSSLTVGPIFFGYNAGNGITLTVTGAAVTLTSSNITQNNYPSDDQFTVLTGTGNIVCTGDFNIGDGTPPSSGSKNVTSITSTISHITINGNLNFKAIGTGTGSQSNNYPYFGLDKNQLTLLGQMIFTSTNNPYSYGGGRNGAEYYQNIARFNMDTNGANPTTLELQNANPIATPIDLYYVDFSDLGGSSTVIYDDPNPNDTQIIYTTATTGLGVNNYNYIDLKLSGASTKRFLGNNCTIGGDLSSDGPGSVDMFTNSPNVTVTGNWANTTNVSQGGATITVNGDMTNNANTITCGSGTLTVNGQFTNAVGSFLCGTGKVVYKGGYLNSATFTPGPTPGMVYFTNTQTLKDNSTGGTMFNDVTCNNGTATMSSGNFSLSNVGRLYVNNGSKLAVNGTAPAANFTLISDQTSTATVEALANSTGTVSGTITGTVNVQRYVTGGTPYRGYRSFSSPVNISGILNQNGTTASTNEGFIDPTYLNSGMLTGGPGTGFRVVNANPLSYLYDDTRASSAYHFYSGKNVGIYSIAGSPNNTVTIYNTDGSVVPTPIKVPVGNAFMVYYAGTTALSNPSPESTVVTATGTLNQGTVNIWLFKTDGSVTRTLTKIAGNALLGLNQVGNPYASTIQLSSFYNDNSGSIGTTVYLLDPTTGISGTYLGYNASTKTSSSTNRASNYVVSGQGFWITAKAGVATPTIAFKETEKVDYPAITSATTSSGSPSTGGTLLMDIPPTASNNDVTAGSFAENTATSPATNTANSLVGLHLQLSKDSVASIAYTQTGIYFSNLWTDTFNAQDDALDRDGTAPKVYLSSYSSDAQRLCINQLADYSKGKRIKLYAAATTSGVYYMSLADLLNVDTVNYNIYLVDHKMNDSLDMVKYKSYGFNINTTDTSTFGANRFTLAVERKALPPYALITFSGQKVSNGVQLFWKTLNEGTYTTFALQKLGGSNTYSSIYTTQGTGAGIYSDVDLHPSNGANTYRLQQTDINGIVTYSQPVTVNYSARATNGSLTIYPNPSKSIINISLNSTNTGSKNYVADIYNTSGSIISHKVVSTDTWTQDISSYKLGVYVIEIKTDTGNLVGQSKFVKIN